MPSEAAWPCWIEVDLDAIAENVASLRGLVGPSCRLMAVVKAQAYGHGARMVARAAVEAGAEWLAVARVREGIELREFEITSPILVLGCPAPGEESLAVEHDLRPTVVNFEQARRFSEEASARGREVPLHLKVDTGLARYGASPEDLKECLPRIRALPGIRVEGLYSHFASADDPDSSYASGQLRALIRARREFEEPGFEFSLCHIAASAGILAISDSHMDMVRAGISLYGLYPSPHLREQVALRPALSFHSRVARVFSLAPGQSVGYGRTFVADRFMRAALVPVGYADGLPRSHSNVGFVLINGVRYRLIGRVSMDQCVADVTEGGPVREGDPVVVIGPQGKERISCDEFAERSGTITNEVLTSLGSRVPRVYTRGGVVAAIGYLHEGRLERKPHESRRDHRQEAQGR